MPHFAHISGIVFDIRNVRLSSGHSTNVHFIANRGKIRQSVTVKRIRELPRHCDEKGNIDPAKLDYLMPWSESLPEECRKPRRS